MKKPLVVFVSLGDWANSTYEAVQAINRVGQIEARHITFWEHPSGYPTDVLVDIAGKPVAFNDAAGHEEAAMLFEEADLIHPWNCEYMDFYNQGSHGDVFHVKPVPLPIHKVRSCTFAGSAYRHNHAAFNQRAKSQGIHVCVEDPTFHWDGEQTEFIPHAVNTDGLIPASYFDRDAMAMGCYNPGRDYYDRDLALLQRAIDEHANGLHLVMNRKPINWNEHLVELSRCWFYFQSMDEMLGTFGRSALEASSMGIPTFSYISDKACEHTRGGFEDDDLGIINITPQTLPDVLHKAVIGDLGGYEELATRARRWVVKHYSYPVVGQYYTDMLLKQMKG